MIRDFLKLSLWNLVHVGFIHFFQPNIWILFFISFISMVLSMMLAGTRVYHENPRLIFHILAISFIFMQLPIRHSTENEVIRPTRLFLNGEIICIMISISQYLELSTYLPERQAEYARMRGCPGH